jgi:hypothetical protein
MWHHTSRRLFGTLALLGLMHAALAAPSLIPGTDVVLQAPPGFTASARFTGFEAADLGASIVVTQLPAPFDTLRQSLDAKGLASRGMTLLEAEDVQLDGQPARLLHLQQQANGQNYLKWMLLSGSPEKTTLTVASYPVASADKLGPALREAVLSQRQDKAAAQDPLYGLPFRITPAAPLKLAGRVGNMLLLNPAGALPKPGETPPEGAIYVIGPSVSQQPIDDLPAFAKARATQTAQLKGLKLTSERPLQLDGLTAYELTGHGSDTKTGEATQLYQVIIRESNAYYIIQGLAKQADGNALEAFRQTTASFKRQQP